MSFRRDKIKSDKWNDWLRRNADTLIAECGVPREIVMDEHRCWYLEHHGDDGVTGWSIELLSDQQAKRLRELAWNELGERGFLWKDIDRLLERRRSNV
jgi:hypothetical protein